MNRSTAFSWRMIGLSLVSAGMAIGVAWLDRSGVIPGPIRPAASLAPVVPLVAFFVGITRWIRGLDELQRMIHLEALVVQFAATGILVMSYGMLAKAALVPNLRATQAFPVLWMALFLSWAAGIVVIRRKYQ